MTKRLDLRQVKQAHVDAIAKTQGATLDRVIKNLTALYGFDYVILCDSEAKRQKQSVKAA